MGLLRAINNNLKHDIWGNYMMSRQLGPMTSYGYLARKSLALFKAIIANKTVTINNREFFDTWN
jgi:hypothetical protein